MLLTLALARTQITYISFLRRNRASHRLVYNLLLNEKGTQIGAMHAENADKIRQPAKRLSLLTLHRINGPAQDFQCSSIDAQLRPTIAHIFGITFGQTGCEIAQPS